MKSVNLDLAKLRLADALLNWYDTTHANGFGHDHHCPVPIDNEPDPRCTCGWTAVLLAEKARNEEVKNAKS